MNCGNQIALCCYQIALCCKWVFQEKTVCLHHHPVVMSSPQESSDEAAIKKNIGGDLDLIATPKPKTLNEIARNKTSSSSTPNSLLKTDDPINSPFSLKLQFNSSDDESIHGGNHGVQDTKDFNKNSKRRKSKIDNNNTSETISNFIDTDNDMSTNNDNADEDNDEDKTKTNDETKHEVEDEVDDDKTKKKGS